MILEYIKGFLTLFLLMKVLLYFVPKNVFEKYIAFFAGVILVIGLLYPVMQFLGREDAVSEKINLNRWEERISKISAEAEKIETSGKTLTEERYQKIIEEAEKEIVIDPVTVKIESKMQAGDIDE